MSAPIDILWLADGKPGHENQSRGLIEAMERRAEISVTRVECGTPRRSGVGWHRVWNRRTRADLAIGAGHRTHFPLLLTSRLSGARSVVLMKPSMPLSWFDLCVVPQHDLADAKAADRKGIFVTRGVLNSVPPASEGARAGTLVLIGGSSKRHLFDGRELTDAIVKIGRAAEDGVTLADSRRTPDGFLKQLAREIPAATIVRHQDSGSGWLPMAVARAREVWVSEDSVSMVYEALSGGAAVGTVAMARRKMGPDRVQNGLDALAAGGWITRFGDWQVGVGLARPPSILREADRCAEWILKHWFPGHRLAPGEQSAMVP